MFKHLLHDERVADDEVQALRRLIVAMLLQDFAEIETNKLHEP